MKQRIDMLADQIQRMSQVQREAFRPWLMAQGGNHHEEVNKEC